jgi:cytochrome P450
MARDRSTTSSLASQPPGLLTSDGDKWKQRRRLLTPAFHFDTLRTFFTVYNSQALILVDKLAKSAASAKPFDVFPYITHCALDIICLAAMDKSANAQSDGNTSYVRAVYAASELLWKRMVSPWLWNDKIYSLTPSGRHWNSTLNILHGFTREVIESRRRQLAAGAEQKGTFLDLLLNHNLSDEALQEEVDTFMFEGHDTTSSGMVWTLFLLGHHPEAQRRVQAEIDAVVGKEVYVTLEHCKSLKYLDCVIKEVMAARRGLICAELAAVSSSPKHSADDHRRCPDKQPVDPKRH